MKGAPVGMSVVGVSVGAFVVETTDGGNVRAIVILVASSLTETLGEFSNDDSSSEAISFVLRITVMVMAPDI